MARTAMSPEPSREELTESSGRPTRLSSKGQGDSTDGDSVARHWARSDVKRIVHEGCPAYFKRYIPSRADATPTVVRKRTEREANVLGKEHRVINVRVVSNGRSGIILNGYGHLVKDCTVEDNSNNFVYIYDGIYAGYCSTVSDNIVYKNGGDGIRVADGCSVTGNTSCDNNGNGVQAGDGGTVAGNTVRLNFADGINVSSDCLVLGNNCVSNGIEVPNGDGAGVFADGDGNRIEGNNVIKNGRGIDIDGTGNIIIKNTASDNTDVTGSPSANYDIAVGNAYGQIINVAGGGGFINTDPTANFEF